MLRGNRFHPITVILVDVAVQLIPDASVQSSRAVPVVAIDHHDVARAGILHWSGTGDLELRGSFRTAPQYLASAVRSTAGRVVVVYDPEIGDNALDFHSIEQLAALDNPVVAYSRSSSSEIVLRCLDHGAMCYLAKSEPHERLIEVVSAAWTGRQPVSPTVRDAQAVAIRYGRPGLTVQEQRVLLAWLRTIHKWEVAERLHITLSTVRTHIQRIRRRYEAVGRSAPDKAALLARAIQDGFVGLGDL